MIGILWKCFDLIHFLLIKLITLTVRIHYCEVFFTFVKNKRIAYKTVKLVELLQKYVNYKYVLISTLWQKAGRFPAIEWSAAGQKKQLTLWG